VRIEMPSNIFDSTQCQLGESATWIESRNSFAWLDILSRKLFEKSPASLERIAVYDLPFTASAIVTLATLPSYVILLVAENGVHEFNLDTGAILVKHRYDLPSTHRTNDAGIDPFGRIVFGVMEWEPSGLNGWVSRINHNGSIEVLIDRVGIPNTLVWSDDGATLYFADSYIQTMFAADYSEAISLKRILYSLDGAATPDGSDLTNKYLYNAEWDGWRVSKRCLTAGEFVGEVKLPVPRPTSCAIGNGIIVITTAKVDLTEQELIESPCSGMTYIVSLDDFEVGAL
jgi:sugar lactone lactonase YvrE